MPGSNSSPSAEPLLIAYSQSSTGTSVDPKHYRWQTEISRSSLIQKTLRRQKSKSTGRTGSMISLAGYPLTASWHMCSLLWNWEPWRRKNSGGWDKMKRTAREPMCTSTSPGFTRVIRSALPFLVRSRHECTPHWQDPSCEFDAWP